MDSLGWVVIISELETNISMFLIKVDNSDLVISHHTDKPVLRGHLWDKEKVAL